MGIFKAIGLGLTIIILSLLMPEVFVAFEAVLLKFFQLALKFLAAGEYGFTDMRILPASPLLR